MRIFLSKVTDNLAAALGAYLRAWLRLILYACLGLAAGFALGQPALIGGTVLGVAFIAEMIPAVFSAFVDWKSALVTLYVMVWWPLRNQIGSASPVGGEQLPMTSRQAARAALHDQVMA